MPSAAVIPDACQLVEGRVRELQRHRTIVYSVELPASYEFSRETFAEREHAEKFLAELHRLDPDLPSDVRIEERVLESRSAS